MVVFSKLMNIISFEQTWGLAVEVRGLLVSRAQDGT